MLRKQAKIVSRSEPFKERLALGVFAKVSDLLGFRLRLIDVFVRKLNAACGRMTATVE